MCFKQSPCVCPHFYSNFKNAVKTKMTENVSSRPSQLCLTFSAAWIVSMPSTSLAVNQGTSAMLIFIKKLIFSFTILKNFYRTKHCFWIPKLKNLLDSSQRLTTNKYCVFIY